MNQPFWFFSAIIELIRELVISNIQNKFEQDTWKTCQVIVPLGNVKADADANTDNDNAKPNSQPFLV